MSWVIVHYNKVTENEIFHVCEGEIQKHKSRWQLFRKIMPIVLFVLRQI